MKCPACLREIGLHSLAQCYLCLAKLAQMRDDVPASPAWHTTTADGTRGMERGR